MTKRVKEKVFADRPRAKDEREYHLHTAPGSLARHCLLVGDPDRAALIARKLLFDARKVGDHRGLKSFTGHYAGTTKVMAVSVVTTGMGGPSIGIVLPEAVRSGASVFIRVGSCGALWPNVDLGSAVIASGACRYDGASPNWAPIEWPAVADYRVVAALKQAGHNLGRNCPVGIGVTTDCFNEGQSRPDNEGYIPPRILARHEELVRRGALFYSMEEAALFVWCSTHGGLPCGAIDTVYANRITNEFAAGGDEMTAKIALEAMLILRDI